MNIRPKQPRKLNRYLGPRTPDNCTHILDREHVTTAVVMLMGLILYITIGLAAYLNYLAGH